MGRLSSALLIIFSTIAMLLSVYSITKAVDLLIRGDSGCGHVLPRRDLAFGIFMFMLCLLGLVSVIWRVRFLLMIYLTVLVVLAILMIVVTVFMIVGSTKKVKDEKKDGLEKYSPWLQRYLVNEKNWNAFKNCMVQKDVCRKLATNVTMSPFQSGCCNPPIYCGFQSNKNRSWVAPNSGLLSQNHDCITWSNDNAKLCYDCDTCKAAYIQKFVLNWNYMGTLLFFTFIIMLGCFALRADDNSNSGHRGIL